MNDIDGQETEFTDDEVQITDLDPLDSPQHRRALFIAGILKKSLGARRVRYALSGVLLLVLLGTLLLQWPRPAPAISHAAPMPNQAFLSATTAGGLLFVQGSDFTLAAYQLSTWHVHWKTRLPAAADIQTVGQMLVCAFATPQHQTILEALNEVTGKMLWHDTLPMTLPDIIQISRGQATPGFLSGFLASTNALYIQGTNDTVYAIQASSGQISWTYHAHDHATTPGQTTQQVAQLYVRDNVIEFVSREAVTHILNVSTGQEILFSPPLFSSQPFMNLTIDDQMLYTLPPPGGSAIQAFHLPDGQLIWSHALSKDTWAQYEQDGVVYLGANGGATLIALRGSDGHELWRYQASDGQPVTDNFLVNQGTGYLLQQDATLVCIEISNGRVFWRTSIADLKGRVNSNLSFFINNGFILLSNQITGLALPTDVISASDGHLLWHNPGAIANPIIFFDTLYTIANNGQVDAWRESDGRRLWSFSAPPGSSVVWTLQTIPTLLFLQDIMGNLYALRATDGKLLWRYP